MEFNPAFLRQKAHIEKRGVNVGNIGDGFNISMYTLCTTDLAKYTPRAEIHPIKNLSNTATH